MTGSRCDDPERPSHRLALTHWAPVIACLAAILALTILPTMPPAAGVEVPDKLAHAVAFGTLAALALRAVRATWTRRARAVAQCVALVSSIGVAGAIELIQHHVPGRSCDVADFCWDIVGILVAVACVAGWARAAPRPTR